MSKKQYVNSSNHSPSMMLGFPWMLVVTVKVFEWPSWVYGVAGTVAVVCVIAFISRLSTEEGIDVVKR
jgi:hypothetical protein